MSFSVQMASALKNWFVFLYSLTVLQNLMVFEEPRITEFHS